MRNVGRICTVIMTAMAGVATVRAESATGVVFDDRNRNGTRDAGEPGLAGVGVSNQEEIVTTDEDGRYTLPVTEDTTLFVIKPRNWMTPVDEEFQLPRFYYTHKPEGSPETEYAGVAPTGPLPESIDFPLHKRAEPDVFSAIFFGDTQARNETELEYMAHDVIRELIGVEADFGVTLGDIVFDNLAIFDQHNRTVALIGIPWYNVIGNHDLNFDAPNDVLSDETYERVFGPNYYSFDHGPVHFVVLDNVFWRIKDGNRGYDGVFGEKQLAWLKKDLARVPDEKLVVLTMHIPLIGCRDREELFRLIEDRPYSLSVSAHTHTQSHHFLTKKDGWKGATPHHHIIHVTACGSWWQGAPDERGIPHTTMRDGAPNGYSIVTFDGHTAKFTFKAASQPAAFQMNIYAPYTVRPSEAVDTEVLANIFGGSEKSIVHMRLGESEWIPMVRVSRKDPYKVAIQKLEQSDTPPPGLKMSAPVNSEHIWMGTLPPNPPEGLTMVEVRTTDMYGQSYTDARPIHIKAE